MNHYHFECLFGENRFEFLTAFYVGSMFFIGPNADGLTVLPVIHDEGKSTGLR